MLEFYNTLTKRVEAVRAGPGGLLRMYSCGPAGPRPGLGDLRSGLLADLIRRNAEQRHRLTVLTCEGITDSATGGAQDEADTFRADCSALNLRPAEQSPRASQWPGLMTDLISRLIEGGHAYPDPGGSVYFDARSFPGYGALSGNHLDELRPGHRTEGAVDENKRFHADWALWKGAPAGRELTWPTPWGTGFPGWHTECSAMSLQFLGDVIDIHTGGIDLRFPHHEDERAQSDSLAGHVVVRHWVHGEHVLFEGRKMAKSTGNVVLLADVTGRGLDPLAARLAFLEHRYRQQMNLTWDTLTAADGTVRRWRELVADWANEPSRPISAEYWPRISAALDDDLDTPAALRALRELARDGEIPAGSKFETFSAADRVLGLDLVSLVGKPRPAAVLPPGAQPKLDERAAARQRKDFASSDRLRAELAELGVHVADTPEGQTWTLTGLPA